jgi:hypothetical protein
MRKISSDWTFFYKRIFPIIWIGILGIVLFAMLFVVPHPDPFSFIPAIFVPLLMMVIGFVLFKKLLFDLADEVFEDGDALVVKNGSREERIAFTDIKNVGYAQFMNPPRVTLSLRRPSVFGDQVAFCAPVRIFNFASNPVIDDLIDRIDAARRKRD